MLERETILQHGTTTLEPKVVLVNCYAQALILHFIKAVSYLVILVAIKFIKIIILYTNAGNRIKRVALSSI